MENVVAKVPVDMSANLELIVEPDLIFLVQYNVAVTLCMCVRCPKRNQRA